MISSIFLLDKQQTGSKLKYNLIFIAKLFANMRTDEQQDLMGWINDVLTKKAAGKHNVDFLTRQNIFKFRGTYSFYGRSP